MFDCDCNLSICNQTQVSAATFSSYMTVVNITFTVLKYLTFFFALNCNDFVYKPFFPIGNIFDWAIHLKVMFAATVTWVRAVIMILHFTLWSHCLIQHPFLQFLQYNILNLEFFEFILPLSVRLILNFTKNTLLNISGGICEWH